jgi:hypothetical protein
MIKEAKLTVMIEPEFRRAVQKKASETGVPYAIVVRRALMWWLWSNELPEHIDLDELLDKLAEDS